MESGAMLAFGSDAPIESADPLAGIHAAVTRKRAEDRSPWYPQEKIPVSKAVEFYTDHSAKSCCFGEVTGSLEVGKRADFAVLSDDIIRMKPGDIHKAKNLATVVDGEFVFGGTEFPES
jgi:predicted amidohydrolase YtcJ